uniref:G-protein coupled receptors family 1 profile domain-containing protein n=1 Tax=Strigamia maritima TaxID=126957 RepID=T1IYS5_STRMM
MTDLPDFSSDDLALSNDSDALANCSNAYCVSDDEYLEMMEDFIFPNSYEWVLIVMHTFAFTVGIVGNFLVGLAVYRNQSMQTVTNFFIVNLALADFLVILVCLPPTVLWDVTETWFFGSVLCKIVVYTQTASISVSVLTLTFISLDRYYAICHPLTFSSTTAKAKTAILVVLETRPGRVLPIETVYFTDCKPLWEESSQKTYTFVLMTLLYIIPFLLMSFAYYKIVRVLWKKDIPGSSEVRKTKKSFKNGDDGTGKKSLMPQGQISSTQAQINSRRKAAKMLIAVVVMFGICYFPVHLLNVLRYTVGLETTHITVTVSLLSHWLCYANSAMNPVIYNFMSGKFRQEFKRACLCFCGGSKRLHQRSNVTTARAHFNAQNNHNNR